MVKPIYVQLWTLRNEMKDDFEGTIKTVAEIGFCGVEPIGIKHIPHPQQATVYQKHGLGVISFHCSGADLLSENIADLIKSAKAYNAKYIVAGTSPKRKEDFSSQQAINELVLAFNRAGEIAAQHGLKVGLHNHDWEMQLVDGRPAVEYFAEQINEHVIIELDAYWAEVGGVDVANLMKRYGQKIPLIHIKDGPLKDDEKMLPFGRGAVNIPAIVAAASNVEALIVELDDVSVVTHMEATRESFDYMIRNGLGKGR